MNTLKAMAENAILNSTPTPQQQQQISNPATLQTTPNTLQQLNNHLQLLNNNNTSGFVNGNSTNELTIANLLGNINNYLNLIVLVI
jgi:hypothetical protein